MENVVVTKEKTFKPAIIVITLNGVNNGFFLRERLSLLRDQRRV